MAEETNTVQQAVEATPGLSITLDIADAVSAVFWPLLILIIVLVSKRHLPAFFANLPKLFDRVQKISIGNFSLDLAKVTGMAPEWTATDSSQDMRKSMSSAEINDSSAFHFIEQVKDTTPVDYAIVDLGEGQDWLSSRLYILSVLLERSKNIGVFVFVRTVGKRSRKLVGWAEPEAIRWSLARRFPWLESAYATSYWELFSGPTTPGDVQIVSNTGMLGQSQEGTSPQLLILMMETFLREIQLSAPPSPEEENQWVEIQATLPTWEHARWLTEYDIEDILGDELQKQYVHATELDGKTSAEGAKRLLQVRQRYVPVVDDRERFRELIDRQIVLDQVAAELVKT